jgi:hypothetical protein
MASPIVEFLVDFGCARITQILVLFWAPYNSIKALRASDNGET